MVWWTRARIKTRDHAGVPGPSRLESLKESLKSFALIKARHQHQLHHTTPPQSRLNPSHQYGIVTLKVCWSCCAWAVTAQTCTTTERLRVAVSAHVQRNQVWGGGQRPDAQPGALPLLPTRHPLHPARPGTARGGATARCHCACDSDYSVCEMHTSSTDTLCACVFALWGGARLRHPPRHAHTTGGSGMQYDAHDQGCK